MSRRGIALLSMLQSPPDEYKPFDGRNPVIPIPNHRRDSGLLELGNAAGMEECHEDSDAPPFF